MKPFKVPFSGEYNSRISNTNALSASSGIIGIGVIGTFIIGAVTQASDKDERYINCFLTKEGAKNYIVKRPGMGVNNAPAAGSIGSAILVWTGSGAGTSVISAFGVANSTIYSGTSSLGMITGKATAITETFVSTTPTLVISSNDSTGWYYDTGVGTMTKITDGDFPGNAGFTLAGTFAHIDGFALIMDTVGNLWAPAVNSVTSWAANSFDTNSAYPDKGIGAVRYKNLVMCFGTESVQFWQNSGLTPFPFTNIPSMTQKVGAVSADAIATMSDTVYWCGGTAQGGLSIFQFDGQVSRISNPEQDFQLVIAGPTNISLTTLRFYGRSFVLVKANSTTYVYCVEDKRWHEWTSDTPLWYKCAGLSSGSQVLTYSVSNIATSGKVYLINPASLVFADDGSAYTATAQSMSDDNGTTNRKFYHELRVPADIEPTTSNLIVSTSDDDFVTFDIQGTIDLSNQAPITRLGSSNPSNGNKRAWKFVNSSNAAMRFEVPQGTMSVGSR